MPKLLLLGDSHAGGLKPHVTAIARRLGWNAEVHFKNGLPTSRLSELLVPAQLAAADLVVAVTGTNDLPIVGGPGYAEFFGTMTRLLGEHGARVAWWGPPVLFRSDLVELPQKVNALAAPAVKAAGGLWVDSRSLTGLRADYDAGGVHPTRGYARWAEGALAQTLSRPRSESAFFARVLLGLGAVAGLAWLLNRPRGR